MSNNPEEGELERQWFLWKVQKDVEEKVSVFASKGGVPVLLQKWGDTKGCPWGSQGLWSQRWETLEGPQPSATQRGWGGHQYDEQACGGEMRRKQNGLCTVDRGGTRDARVERNSSMWVTCTVTWGQGNETKQNPTNPARASRVLSKLYPHRATSSAPSPYTYTFL